MRTRQEKLGEKEEVEKEEEEEKQDNEGNHTTASVALYEHRYTGVCLKGSALISVFCVGSHR